MSKGSKDVIELRSIPLEPLSHTMGNERAGLLPSNATSSSDFEAPDGQDPFQEDKDRLDSHQKSSSSVRKGSNDLERQESGRSLKDGKHPDRSQSAFLTGLLPSHFDVTGDEGGKERLKKLTPWKRYYAVAIFTLTASLLYADQNLIAPMLSDIAAEFGFNDEEKDRYLGGYVAGLFFIVGAPAALLCGWLCDRYDRRLLLLFVVLLGEGPCLATYFVTNYWQFLMLRVLTGISVGGTLPLVYSLVGDLFDHHQRATVAAGIQIATGVGLAAGQGISGFVGPHTGWRWPFVIVAIPAILVAILMICTTTEPPRGAAESALAAQYEQEDDYVYNEKVTWEKVRIVASTFSNWCVVLQGLPGSLPWGVLLTFLNDYLAQDQKLTTEQATAIITFWGIGGGVGVLAGGAFGQWLYNRRKMLMPLFVGACISLATLPIWWLINARLLGKLLLWPFAAAALGGALSSPPGPNARAVILNVNEPENRGLILGMMTVLDDVGKSAGPFIVSQLIGLFHRRVPAFNICVAAWILCGIIFSCTSFTLSKDEAAMQERLKAKARQRLPTSELSADAREEFSTNVSSDSDSQNHRDTAIDFRETSSK